MSVAKCAMLSTSPSKAKVLFPHEPRQWERRASVGEASKPTRRVLLDARTILYDSRLADGPADLPGRAVSAQVGNLPQRPGSDVDGPLLQASPSSFPPTFAEVCGGARMLATEDWRGPLVAERGSAARALAGAVVENAHSEMLCTYTERDDGLEWRSGTQLLRKLLGTPDWSRLPLPTLGLPVPAPVHSSYIWADRTTSRSSSSDASGGQALHLSGIRVLRRATGESLIVELEEFESANELKVRLTSMTGLPTEAQELWVKARSGTWLECDDDRSLSDYGVPWTSVLLVVQVWNNPSYSEPTFVLNLT